MKFLFRLAVVLLVIYLGGAWILDKTTEKVTNTGRQIAEKVTNTGRQAAEKVTNTGRQVAEYVTSSRLGGTLIKALKHDLGLREPRQDGEPSEDPVFKHGFSEDSY